MIVTRYTADVGMAWLWLAVLHRILPKRHSRGGFLQWSQGHLQFSSVVTWSQAVFGQLQACDPCRSSKYGAYWSDNPLLIKNGSPDDCICGGGGGGGGANNIYVVVWWSLSSQPSLGTRRSHGEEEGSEHVPTFQLSPWNAIMHVYSIAVLW